MVDSHSHPLPQILSPCSSGRRSSCDTKSPNSSFGWSATRSTFHSPISSPPTSSFPTAFSSPSALYISPDDPPPPPPPAAATTEASEEIGSGQAPEPEPINAQELAGGNSKRWKHIFSKSDKKRLDSPVGSGGDSVGAAKEKKREKKINGGGVASAAELNINIWPFSRSRSAGNGGNRPRAAVNRKVSSAPCSRSNSTGESKLRKWPSSPSRAGGVHLGRNSPVWQVRRGGVGGRSTEAGVRNAEKGGKNEARRKIPPAAAARSPKARVLSLNVPMCIGYRHNLSCKSDENSAVSIAAAAAGGGGRSSQIGGGVAGEGGRGRSNLFNLRSLFTKKVY